MLLKYLIFSKPSTAAVIEIGGVIIPSANKAAPPIIAGSTSHRFCLLTSAYRANVPPSPLLSALKTNMTYLIVVCKVIVHIIQDKLPIIKNSSMVRPLIIALKTYKGDVPISP